MSLDHYRWFKGKPLFEGTKKQRCFEFRSITATQIGKFGFFTIDKAWLEDLLYTFHYFDGAIPYQPLRAQYVVNGTRVTVFIHPEDLEYMKYCMGLKELQLIQSNIFVETKIPFLLRGLVFRDDKLFWLCYTELCKMIPLTHFMLNRNRIQTEFFGHVKTHYYFGRLLEFLGRCFKRKKVNVEDCSWRKPHVLTPLLRSVSYFIRNLTKTATGTTRYVTSNKFICKGLPCHNNVYGVANIKLKPEQTSFECTVEQMLKIYNICFANDNYKAFVDTYEHDLITSIGKSQHGTSRIMQGMEFVFNKRKRDASTDLKCRLAYLSNEYMSLPNLGLVANDTDRDTLKATAVLVLLDGFLFYPFADDIRQSYSLKTSMYISLQDVIKKKSLNSSPLFVPVVNDVEGKKEQYCKETYVLPFYNVRKEYDISNVTVNVTKNKFVKPKKY
tara:strand:- start:1619 stop:2944 length:1326 start_codon:yes stop_codon:yes gene_type:complete